MGVGLYWVAAGCSDCGRIQKNQIRVWFSTTFKSGLIPIWKCQIQCDLCCLHCQKQIGYGSHMSEKNRIQVTCNCSVTVAYVSSKYSIVITARMYLFSMFCKLVKVTLKFALVPTQILLSTYSSLLYIHRNKCSININTKRSRICYSQCVVVNVKENRMIFKDSFLHQVTLHTLPRISAH